MFNFAAGPDMNASGRLITEVKAGEEVFNGSVSGFSIPLRAPSGERTGDSELFGDISFHHTDGHLVGHKVATVPVALDFRPDVRLILQMIAKQVAGRNLWNP